MNSQNYAFSLLNNLCKQGVGRHNLYKFVLLAKTEETYKKEFLKDVPANMWDEVLVLMKNALS